MENLLYRMLGYDKEHSFLTQPRLPVYLAILAILLSSPVLSIGLQLDDYMHRTELIYGWDSLELQGLSPFGLFAFLRGNPEVISAAMEHGIPWWTYDNLSIAFWRPLAEVTMWLDYRLWPDIPALMHLQNILWYSALVWAAALLFRRIVGATPVAGLSALLYTISCTHADSLNMVACRTSLMATFFGILALVSFDSTSREQWKPGVIIGPFLLALAFLSAEYAIVAVAYLFAYVVFLDQNRPRNRMMNVFPYFLVVVGWMIIYKWGAFGTSGSGAYIDPIREPSLFVDAFIRRFPILFAGQWFILPIRALLAEFTAHSVTIVTTILTGILVLVLVPFLFQDRRARFWFTGFALALIPMCAPVPAERLLIFVGLGASGLLAHFLSAVYTKQAWLPKHALWVIPARILFPALVLVHLILSPLLFPILPLRLAHVLDKAVYTPALHMIPLGVPWYSQTLIYINPPASVVAYNVHVRLCHDLIPPSKQTWVLSSASTSMQITRLDEQTLEIEQEEGFMHGRWNNIFRNSLHPMKIGQEVALSGLTVKVLSLTDDSRPKRVSFHFDTPLEDASLNFVEWRLYEYIPFTPPEIGETVSLPARPLKVL